VLSRFRSLSLSLSPSPSHSFSVLIAAFLALTLTQNIRQRLRVAAAASALKSPELASSIIRCHFGAMRRLWIWILLSWPTYRVPAISKVTSHTKNTLNNCPANLTCLVFFFVVHLFKLKTYHEVVDEIYYQVKHMEPWERGSRKTSGQTGMCGGVSLWNVALIVGDSLLFFICCSSDANLIFLILLKFLGTWRWRRRHCIHRLLFALQALHAPIDTEADQRAAQSHRLGLHTGTR